MGGASFVFVGSGLTGEREHDRLLLSLRSEGKGAGGSTPSSGERGYFK